MAGIHYFYILINVNSYEPTEIPTHFIVPLHRADGNLSHPDHCGRQKQQSARPNRPVVRLYLTVTARCDHVF